MKKWEWIWAPRLQNRIRAPILIITLLIFTGAVAQSKYQKDFDFYWNTVNDNFGYFDTQKTKWIEARSIYQSRVDTITVKSSFVQLLEDINNELYNGHISLNTNLPSSNRLIPTGADLWVVYESKQFIVSAVREAFGAEKSGIKPGMRITRFNGELIENGLKQFLPKSVPSLDKNMFEYAANMLLAGRHNTERTITAVSNGVEKTFQPDRFVNTSNFNYTTVIESRKLPSNIGYIKVNNSLGNDELIRAFDDALDKLWNTKGLIIDLRETPSGGNSNVARGIMSRFIEKDLPYQKHSLPAEEKQYGVKRSWVEYVSPRGKIYKKPLVILVNRWTGSMGEGLAIGFDAMKRARIIGDRMAGLIGAIYSFQLPESGFGFSIPVEKLFHVNGTPREQFKPVILIRNNKDYIPTAVKIFTKS